MGFQVFISHSGTDANIANAVCARIEEKGLRCWIAPRDIAAGQVWAEAIIEGLEQCRIMVIILSSKASQSSQVLNEITAAVNHSIPILPFRIESFELPKALEYYLGKTHWMDALTMPMDNHIESLCQEVQAVMDARNPKLQKSSQRSLDDNTKRKTEPQLAVKYCQHCGMAMKDNVTFCGQCGSKGSPSIPFYATKSFLIGVAAALVIAIGGYVASLPASPSNRSNQSVLPAPATSAPTPPSSAQIPEAQLNDFRFFAQAKERFNTDIVNLANLINGRINQTGGLRSSKDLQDQAQKLIRDVEQNSSQLAAKDYPAEMQNVKALLLQLFDLEVTRARSLYNGMVEGANGQDYKSSFSVGTSASYKFDEVNNKFVQENDSLNSKVRR